jgi:hypothetical protein
LKIIDAHVHYSRIASFAECARHTSIVDYSEHGFLSECSEYEVVKSVCMGLVEAAPGGFPDKDAQTPMIADMAENMPSGMSLCLGMNPHMLTSGSLVNTEEMLKNGDRVVGIKIYAGYYHVDVTDPIYNPVYKLAEKYDKTIVIHTGETFSDRGLLKYSHPLRVDDLAVAHPDMRIVACHMGAPWVFDACEVAGKNPNVFIDISGLLVGNAGFIRSRADMPLLIDRYRQALVFLDDYDKVMYGTDWPLVPMGAYIDFCKKLIPAEHHEKVFYDNTVRVYRLK